MEGIKSKNAKVRSECLDELATLIQRNGISVCSTPSKVFPSIAAQIADRDASVRNAAMLVITQTYQVIGETVYKYIGKIPDKDRSLLDEKIRRLPAATSIPVIENTSIRNTLVSSPITRLTKIEPAISASITSSPVSIPIKSSRSEFSLDLDTLGIPNSVPELKSEVASTNILYTSQSSTRKMEDTSREGLALDNLLSRILSSDYEDCISAIRKIEKIIIDSPHQLQNVAQEIINSSISQLKTICTSSEPSVYLSKACRHILHLISIMFLNPDLSQRMERDVLFKASEELLSRMHDPILNVLDAFSTNPNNPTLSKNMSSVMIRIIESANKNLIIRFN